VSDQQVYKIIECEGTIYGTAHKNKNGSVDYGQLQINSIHQKEMEQLGLNIATQTDDLIFGFILMKREGLRPWSASEYCWSK
jgi:hypothetical protein